MTTAPAIPAAAPTPPSPARGPSKFTLWLLTPGWRRQSPAARLRGWARWLDWYESSWKGRVRLFERVLSAPIRAWWTAGVHARRYGHDLGAARGISQSALRRDLWWMRMRHGFNGQTYVDFQLYRSDRRRIAAAYVAEPEYLQALKWFNRRCRTVDDYPVADKLRFAAWCRAHGLPTAPVLVEYEAGAPVAADLAVDAPLPPADLFTKPTSGTGGHATARWLYRDGGWVGRDGVKRSEAELRVEIADLSRTLHSRRGQALPRILVQRCVRNHDELLPLTPGALATVRVLTYRQPGGPPNALLGVLKLPTGDAPADNFHFGGILVPVDLETGRLGQALARQGTLLVPVDRHPDTGATIAGRVLPRWHDTLELAERGLAAAPGRPSIGWDIAITPDGPMLIEGNTASNPDIAQAPTGHPLSATPFPAAVEQFLRVAVGEAVPTRASHSA